MMLSSSNRGGLPCVCLSAQGQKQSPFLCPGGNRSLLKDLNRTVISVGLQQAAWPQEALPSYSERAAGDRHEEEQGTEKAG